jgi:hypothetical protein
LLPTTASFVVFLVGFEKRARNSLMSKPPHEETLRTSSPMRDLSRMLLLLRTDVAKKRLSERNLRFIDLLRVFFF